MQRCIFYPLGFQLALYVFEVRISARQASAHQLTGAYAYIHYIARMNGYLLAAL